MLRKRFLVLFLSLLLSFGAVMPAAAQESLVRECNQMKGTQLIEPQVAAGDATSFFLRQDQKLWGWGHNSYGQAGNGEFIPEVTEEIYQPTPFLLTKDGGFNQGFKQVAGGRWHSLAVKNDGTVWGWGDNQYGQLGNLDPKPHSTPLQIPDLQDIKAVACGEFFSLALDKDGFVWAWGHNASNELGRGGSAQYYKTPQQVKGLGGSGYLDNVKAIACGRFHSLAIKNNGTVWAWGDGTWGNFGNGEDFPDEIYPVQVLNLTNVTSITAGNYFNLALKNDGTVWAWGGRESGQLGDGEEDGFVNAPQPVKGLNGLGNLGGIKAITSGINHSLALKNDGTILAWGGNYGRLGDGTDEGATTPVATKNLTGVLAIAGGAAHSLAWKNDGTVWGWGDNASYQLGIEEHDNLLPVQVTGIPLLARPLTGLSVQAADGSGPAQLLTCFKPDVTGYEMIVENPLEAVKITPAAVSGATAVVKLNGAEQSDGIVNLAVDPGLNKVEMVSSPGEFHPKALSEPDLNLSAHPAPIIQPLDISPSASARTTSVRVWQS
ncbi:MAG: cadherin-like beta sandwich domain-containing protein [Firmicutes bacterium]|nr:cadherin-like beta sandwich domain-containing protein [Bacillota bacterium]